MDRRQKFRRMALCVGLFAIGCILMGLGTEPSSDTAVAEGVTAKGANSAVLSPRRTPELVGRATAGRRLKSVMAPLLARAPADHCVVAAHGGQRLIDDQGERALLPASNLKLLTATAVLSELEPDTKFKTVVAARSPLGPRGEVAGDLWFIGGGDPLIVTEPYRATNRFGPSVPHTSLESIADAVVATGVRHVTGRLVGDESRYDTQRTIPSWPDRYLAEAQVGPLTALTVNDGRTAPVVDAESGTVGPSAEPARYAARALESLLEQRGVAIDGGAATGRAPAQRTILVEIASLPVNEVVREMLSFSDNNSAELMLKELAVQRGDAGTTDGGLRIVREVLARRQIPTKGMVLKDGSGLDRGDRVSCATLQSVLEDQGADGDLAASLSTAGDVGTLFDRYVGSPAKGRLRAKTGTLNDVSALSGWVHTTKGADVSFAILFNGRRVTAADERLEEQITEALLDYPNGPDPATIGPEAVR